EISHFGGKRWSAGPARLPSPESPYQVLLPSNERGRLENEQGIPPVEALRKQHEPDMIEPAGATRSNAAIEEHRQLLAEKEHFREKCEMSADGNRPLAANTGCQVRPRMAE
ncbi:MAG TPA: hypothetical protein VEO74_11370, partial [Thermoanaerobaculia bacterium]|nr:hypothetical protein [Thermoanaerobaculia bacterium]